MNQYAAKAEEFLEVAASALDDELFTAAAGNAVHAGINAVDAILGARQGARAAASDHAQSTRLLQQATKADGEDGKRAVNAFRRLIKLKTPAEYDPAPVSSANGRRAVEAARLLVRYMRRVSGRR